ncbi:LysR substrate-binding domain-containing protein [Vibrio gallicus]|uniref:LysR substrate-binding domain-containing protein n=1 Tax=Vibrio gallicus TaxID=190897 RepID=UPI0021C49370|nr:LysR substrate-binding domain-containing protein [Vibrio gallicus]
MGVHSCIRQTGLEAWTFKTPIGLKTIKVQPHIQIDQGEAIRDAAIDSLGIAMCSESLVYKQIQSGSLIEVLPDFPLHDDASIWAVYPSSRLLASKVRAFVDYFSEYYGVPPYWEK